MGYISHPKFLSSRILGFLPYHSKLGEVLYNSLLILYIYRLIMVFLMDITIFFTLDTVKST